MNRKVPLYLGAFVVAIAAVALMHHGDATTTSESTLSSEATGVVGYTAQIDPVTREFIDAPVVLETSKQLNGAKLSNSDFVIEDAPVGGGKMVNLRGHFQHTFQAKVDAAGAVRIECDVNETFEADDDAGDKE